MATILAHGATKSQERSPELSREQSNIVDRLLASVGGKGQGDPRRVSELIGTLTDPALSMEDKLNIDIGGRNALKSAQRAFGQIVKELKSSDNPNAQVVLERFSKEFVDFRSGLVKMGSAATHTHAGSPLEEALNFFGGGRRGGNGSGGAFSGGTGVPNGSSGGARAGGNGGPNGPGGQGPNGPGNGGPGNGGPNGNGAPNPNQNSFFSRADRYTGEPGFFADLKSKGFWEAIRNPRILRKLGSAIAFGVFGVTAVGLGAVCFLGVAGPQWATIVGYLSPLIISAGIKTAAWGVKTFAMNPLRRRVYNEVVIPLTVAGESWDDLNKLGHYLRLGRDGFCRLLGRVPATDVKELKNGITVELNDLRYIDLAHGYNEPWRTLATDPNRSRMSTESEVSLQNAYSQLSSLLDKQDASAQPTERHAITVIDRNGEEKRRFVVRAAKAPDGATDPRYTQDRVEEIEGLGPRLERKLGFNPFEGAYNKLTGNHRLTYMQLTKVFDCIREMSNEELMLKLEGILEVDRPNPSTDPGLFDREFSGYWKKVFNERGVHEQNAGYSRLVLIALDNVVSPEQRVNYSLHPLHKRTPEQNASYPLRNLTMAAFRLGDALFTKFKEMDGTTQSLLKQEVAQELNGFSGGSPATSATQMLQDKAVNNRLTYRYTPLLSWLERTGEKYFGVQASQGPSQ